MFTIFYKTVNVLSYVLPSRLAYLISKVVAGVMYHSVYRKARLNLDRNLQYVFGKEMKRWKREKIIFETFQSFALFIYEFLVMRRINEKTYTRYVRPVGFQRVRTALKKGNGVICLTGHLGNWEWGAAMLTYLGYPPTVIATRFKNEYVTKFYHDRREQQGMEVAYLEDAVRKTLRKVKQNGLVAILGDRDYTNQGIEVPFFGKMTRFPAGPLLLGRRSGAAIIPAFAIRVGICKYNVYFDEPIELKSKSHKDKEYKNDLRRWAKVLEKYVRKYPRQWYRFEPFWESEKV
jgi:lauroyl/myristoyl acyltransferase